MNLKKLIKIKDAIEKAYFNKVRGGFDNKLEVADWLYSYIKRNFVVGMPTRPDDTQKIINAVQKRYDIEYYSDAEAGLAGLAYDGNVTRKYTFSFDRNYGLYNIYIDKK